MNWRDRLGLLAQKYGWRSESWGVDAGDNRRSRHRSASTHRRRVVAIVAPEADVGLGGSEVGIYDRGGEAQGVRGGAGKSLLVILEGIKILNKKL
jgi:hypothetical protein